MQVEGAGKGSAALALVASGQGRRRPPRGLASSPGREPRLRGLHRPPAHLCSVAPRIPGSSTPAACWLSPGGAGAPAALPDASYLSTCAWGCKPSSGGQDTSTVPTPHCPAVAQPHHLPCKSTSSAPAWGRYRVKSSTLATQEVPQTHGLGKRRVHSLPKCTAVKVRAEPPGRAHSRPAATTPVFHP